MVIKMETGWENQQQMIIYGDEDEILSQRMVLERQQYEDSDHVQLIIMYQVL
jgi:hypothetical protein